MNKKLIIYFLLALFISTSILGCGYKAPPSYKESNDDL
jgi:predicted small lipoprotein YifL